MPEKPRIILVLSLVYLISPLVIVIQAAMNVGLPVFGPLHIWAKLHVLDFFVLAAYPIAAIAIWTISKPGWYGFMLISVFLIASNIFVAVQRPAYQPLLILAYDAVLTGVASIFFRKSIIAPFFHPRLRWWENLPRYKVQVRLVIEGGDVGTAPVLRDISHSGCFITTQLNLALHQEVDAVLQWFGQDLAIKARIVRVGSFAAEAGYGIQFVHLSSATTKQLTVIVQALEQLMNFDTPPEIRDGHVKRPTRIRLTDRAWLIHRGDRTPIDIIDISASGCSFETSRQADTTGPLSLEWELRESRLLTPGRIVWEKASGGRQMYGMVFQPASALTTRALRRLVRQFKTRGARPRIAKPAPPEIIAAAAEQTPYRHIKRITAWGGGSRN